MKPCQPTFSAIFSIERWRYPTSGIALFMTSPSARTTKRSTPCVEGCCGPMLRVMSSVTTPPPFCDRSISTSKPMSPIAAPLYLQQALTRGRDAVVLLRLDEVLAQRMPGPVLRHEQPAKVRMSCEAHAQEIEALALLPVRVRPDGGHGRHDGIVTQRVHLEHDPVAMTVREQVVDHLDVSRLRIVDAREVGEAVESHPRIVAQEERHLGDALGRNFERGVASLPRRRADGIA